MDLKVVRRFKGELYTIGSFFINDTYFCDTVEDKVRKPGVKIPGKTAIPYGKYKVILTHSPKFKRKLPLLLDVPNFTGIRIHRGNNANDSSGCVILGENRAKGMVLNSTRYEEELVKKLESLPLNEKVFIEIV